MTTNNPPIAAWAPSAALAKLASRHNNAQCVLTDGPAEFNDVPLIRLSDYERLQADHERLQAECEELRKDAGRYRRLRMADWLDSPLCAVRNPAKQVKPGSDCPSSDRLDAAIDASMQEPSV